MTDTMNTQDESVFSSSRNPESQEADFSDPFSSDPESLEHNETYIRSLMDSDLSAIKRIDRRAMGRGRVVADRCHASKRDSRVRPGRVPS